MKQILHYQRLLFLTTFSYSMQGEETRKGWNKVFLDYFATALIFGAPFVFQALNRGSYPVSHLTIPLVEQLPLIWVYEVLFGKHNVFDHLPLNKGHKIKNVFLYIGGIHCVYFLAFLLCNAALGVGLAPAGATNFAIALLYSGLILLSSFIPKPAAKITFRLVFSLAVLLGILILSVPRMGIFFVSKPAFSPWGSAGFLLLSLAVYAACVGISLRLARQGGKAKSLSKV